MQQQVCEQDKQLNIMVWTLKCVNNNSKYFTTMNVID